MYKPGRIKRIKELLREQRQMEVTALSNQLGVSLVTVRTDLEELEREGFLTRFHGGAMINQQPDNPKAGVPSLHPLDVDESKREVGSIAAKLVHNKDGIFLGPGTTCYCIAMELKKRKDIVVNIVTNNFYVISALRDAPNFRIHFIGGVFVQDGMHVTTDDLPAILQNIYLDKMFFSIDGIDVDAGYTLSDPTVQDTIIIAAGLSKEVIMVADSSKFGMRSFMKIGDLDFAPIVVTNPGVPAQYAEYFAEHHVRVVSSYQ
jgi:Transcriptional regulators of sugar metabolism